MKRVTEHINGASGLQEDSFFSIAFTGSNSSFLLLRQKKQKATANLRPDHPFGRGNSAIGGDSYVDLLCRVNCDAGIRLSCSNCDQH